MTQNIRDNIKLITEINPNVQSDHNVEWVDRSIPKTKKNPVTYQRDAEIPSYLMDDYSPPSSSKKSNSRKKKKEFNSETKENHDKFNSETKGIEKSLAYKFADIPSNVREVSGGWNTQSNEAIEKRIRERRQKILEESSSSSSDTTYTTVSSEISVSSKSSDSFKTALQNSYKSKVLNQQENNIDSANCSFGRYKKNALISNLLQTARAKTESVYADNTETATNYSADISEASASVTGIENSMRKLNIEKQDEDIMRQDRLERLFQSEEDRLGGRLFQSEEDPDVFYHPLRQGLHNDPEWKKVRLERKGIEIVQSARQFYLSVDNDDFIFESKK